MAAVRPKTLAVKVAIQLFVVVAVLQIVRLGATTPQSGAMSDRENLVGTYRLITVEERDSRGAWAERPGYNSIGYITYADTGHMGVHIMPRSRRPWASGAPTEEEARTALQGYTAYFGSFTVRENEPEPFVVHHRYGQVNPGGEVDAKRFYDFEGDRLILTPAPEAGGAKATAARRIIWERLPDAPLSAEARRFVGFHRLLYTDRYRIKDGREVFHGDRNYERAGSSYIIYTPTGHMMVHLMWNDRRVPYAGEQPTPAEALSAIQSYNGYFGRFTTYENYDPPFVMHNQQGTLRPARDVDATKRFYEFTGNVLRLGAPPRINDAGELEGGHLYWERQPAIE